MGHNVNETTKDIIHQMLIGKKISEIVKFIADKYDITHDIAKKDILEFHRILRINGII